MGESPCRGPEVSVGEVCSSRLWRTPHLQRAAVFSWTKPAGTAPQPRRGCKEGAQGSGDPTNISVSLALKQAPPHAALNGHDPALLHITITCHPQPPLLTDCSSPPISGSSLLRQRFLQIVLNKRGNFGDTLIHKVLLIFSVPRSGAF